jgi:long-chain fatty acid transport protein
MTVRSKLLLSAIILLGLPATAWATNGYFSHGTSVAEKGMAGAGVAYSQDALSAANNPAGMVWQGNRLDVGAALFAPMRSYTVTGTPSGMGFNIGGGDQSIDSENEAFIIPQYGQNWMLDSESSIGISVFGNGGMNTEYVGGTATPAYTEGTFGAGTAGVDLSQLFLATTYARKFSDSASWGISGIVAYQQFEATGLSNFGAFGFSSDPDNLTNNGHDDATGFGIRLGVQAEVSPGITLGAAYQPKIDMSEFDSYSGLFAEQGDFDIPSTFTLGLAWHISDKRVFLVDVQQINYSDVAAVSNPISNLTDNCNATTSTGCLGASDGGGFGWQDMTIVKLGYEWKSDDTWTWRFGYSKTDQPIPESEVVFNILAPGVVEDHFTFGFTSQLNAKSAINFAVMYAPNVSVTGPNTFEAPDQQTVEIEMDQYELALSYSHGF